MWVLYIRFSSIEFHSCKVTVDVFHDTEPLETIMWQYAKFFSEMHQTVKKSLMA